MSPLTPLLLSLGALNAGTIQSEQDLGCGPPHSLKEEGSGDPEG